MKLTRRAALGAMGASACHTVVPSSLLLPSHCVDATAVERRHILSLPYEKSAFPMGAMAGDVREDRAMLWTRVRAVRPSQWGLVVIELDGERSRVHSQRAIEPDADGFVQHEVTGLRPGARYRYSFLRTLRGQPVARGAGGRFRAALHRDSLDPLVFGGTSCTSAQWGSEFDTLRRAASCDELAFFVHAGDHVYADEARTLREFRAVYERTFSRTGLRALHESAGLYTVWDDHEVHNDWDGETVERERFEAARRAFFEHHPWSGGWQRPRRLYERFRWGRTLELFVLDTRGERRPSTRLRPDAQYLSREQLQWLVDGLQTSESVFKCVVNSVPIARFEGLFEAASSDRWQGYPAQRQRLLEAIRDVPNVWFLSGDFHLGCVARVERSGPDRRLIEVLMGPGGQLPNPIASLLDPPQYEFATSESNWVRFEADPRSQTMSVRFVNEEGRAIFERRYRG